MGLVIMNTVFIVTETQVNDYLPEYPKGTQTSIVGTAKDIEGAKELINDAVKYTHENWEDSAIDVELSDENQTVMWGHSGETGVVFIFTIHEQQI